jgi:hypothetical protein
VKGAKWLPDLGTDASELFLLVRESALGIIGGTQCQQSTIHKLFKSPGTKGLFKLDRNYIAAFVSTCYYPEEAQLINCMISEMMNQ